MNTNLVTRNENGQAITNSLLVAEKFEKEHKNVLSLNYSYSLPFGVSR